MIYLDHAATGLPRSGPALEAAAKAAEWANPGRGLHEMQQHAAAGVEAARAALVACGVAGTPCFFSGATAALNQAILGWTPHPNGVALGPMLHNAARRPALALSTSVWRLPADERGHIDVDRMRAEWHPVDLVIINHGSNVNGVLQPVEAVVEIAHSHGAAVIVDAAQTAGYGLWNQLESADAVAFSAHKALAALPGTGVLALHDGSRVEPRVLGGVGFDARDDSMPEELPHRLEAGTPNLPGIMALGAAVAEPSSWDWRETAGWLHEALRRTGLTMFAGELPVASVTCPMHTPRDLEHMLDRAYGIVTRAGLHCAPDAHQILGTIDAGTLRVSCGRTTSPGELDALSRALQEIARG